MRIKRELSATPLSFLMPPNIEPERFSNRLNNPERYDVCVNILKAIANFSSVLLIEENLDNGVNKALEILGKSIKADRLNLLEHYDDPTGETLGHVAVRYEWISDGTESQITHPTLNRIAYDGVENVYRLMSEGKHWSGLIDTLREPFRSGQLKLGVKATYAIPVMVKDKYWGIVALDFCRVGRQLEDAEIEILKMAATCIGSAIERERICQEQEKITQEASLAKQKAAILEDRVSEVSRRHHLLRIATCAAKALLNDRDLTLAIAKALQIVGEGIEADRVAIMKHYDAVDALGCLKMLYEWHSPQTVSQVSHPDLNQVSYEGVEDWYEELSQGNVMGGVVESLPEPLRSGQKEIGVLSTYAIPIAIDDKYWGIIAFDDCRKPRLCDETEIPILKTTAVCIGSAIEKHRVRQQQEQAERNSLLEQQRAIQLGQHNEVLAKRDRILAATATACNILLTGEDFDAAIDRALQIIGETLNTDRVGVIENWHNPFLPEIPHWRLLYEWDAPHTISQISLPELSQGSYEGIEEWYVLGERGQSVSCKLAQMGEPFRSVQEKLGVKVLHAVPIFIEGKHWGVVGFDDCHRETNRSEAELNILKIAAACIGGAIEKERSRKARKEAELAVVNERNRMAREIHDTLAQAFTGISLQLEAASNILATQPEAARTRLLQAKALAKEGIIEARRSVRALRPETLEFNNLAIALQQLMDNMTNSTDLKTQVIVEGEPELTPNLEVDLYRIAQEAITNTLRHAEATELTLSLISTTNSIELQIKDNGIGFEPDRLSDTSFGLIGMQERSDRHNGNLLINSDRDRGTKITITIPF